MMCDGRLGVDPSFRTPAIISELCAMYRTDGVIFITTSDSCDFHMDFFNPDGTGGMMCGNGGRCAVAFASALGIKPHSGKYLFEAGDGRHSGEILGDESGKKIIRISMRNVVGYGHILDGYFINTGARHFVKFVKDVEDVDVAKEGARLRGDIVFAPSGANVDFVSVLNDGTLAVRTFEKGVEAETLACGTGITAAAVVAWCNGVEPTKSKKGRVFYYVHAREDVLTVDFVAGDPAKDIYLTGPAKMCPR